MGRRRKSKESLLELGLKLAFGGGALLVVPLLAGSSPIFDGFKTALRLPGWVLLGIGLLVVGLHPLMHKRRGTTAPAVAAPPERRRVDSRPTATYDQAAARRILKTDDARIEPAFTPATPKPAAPALAPPHERLTRWSPEVFAAIEWRRFEAVCEALFAQAGFETRAQSHGPDGGVDIWLHSRNASGPVAVVQCKHWQGKPVPVSAVREFLGAMTAHKVTRGTYATSSSFTADALAFAQANGINAQDGAGLLRLIDQRTPEQQAALLAVAFEGDYWRPTCPSCGVKMADRAARKSGDHFWGCVNYPRCKYTQPMAQTAAGRRHGER